MREGSPAEVFGPYLVYEELGAGGMASVHRAELTGIEGFRRQVALKRMLPHVAASAEMVQSFVREAHLASHLRHSNVAQTYELGKVGDTYFIAMELIEGKSLRAILKHCAANTGPMPIPVSLNILNQICDALDYAHNLCDETGQPLGIIHRDVSPSNIIVATGGIVKLIDFGIAKVKARSNNTTLTGTVKGKFGYMAPEYIEGSLDARADLFALGVIAHELFTNQPLFSTGEEVETLQRVRSMNIPPPSATNPAVPKEVEEIVMTALSRDPEARWQAATALRTAMTTVTKRLNLEIHNQHVAEWIEWLYAHTPAQPGDEADSIIEHATQKSVKLGASEQLTAVRSRGSAPRPPVAQGTPHRITAQERAESPEAPTGVHVTSRKLTTPAPTIPGMTAAPIRPSQPIAVPRTVTPSRQPPNRPSQPPAQPRPVQPGPARPSHPPQVAPQRGGNLVVAMVLVLLVAAAVAAGVYFGLPLLRT